MFRKSIICFSVLSAGLISGCSTVLNTAGSSTFSCSGESGCPTPFEVYEGTHTSPHTVRNGRTPDNWGVKGAKNGGGFKNEQHQNLSFDLINGGSVSGVASSALHNPSKLSQPIRQPSQVMRIWIAPWIDQGDNLNWSGYVYTEVTPRRWAFGEKEIRYQGGVPEFLPNFPNK